MKSLKYSLKKTKKNNPRKKDAISTTLRWWTSEPPTYRNLQLDIVQDLSVKHHLRFLVFVIYGRVGFIQPGFIQKRFRTFDEAKLCIDRIIKTGKIGDICLERMR